MGLIKKYVKRMHFDFSTGKNSVELLKISKKNQYILDKRQGLNKFAHKLNSTVPKSEIWFRELYQEFKIASDRFNYPLSKYIPDLLNREYKYIIEVDGSIHDEDFQKQKDKLKNKKYDEMGYFWVRIKAFDEDSFKQGIVRICRYRQNQKSRYL